MDENERIRRRAHEIWESEGRPDGQSDRHWREAAASVTNDAVAPAKKAGAKKLAKAAAATVKADAKAAKKEKKKAAPEPKKGDAVKKKGAGKAAKKAG